MKKCIHAVFLIVPMLSLTACVTSSSTANNEAEVAYAHMIKTYQSKHQIDTTSSTAKRIRKIFNHMVPYATTENKTGNQLKWEVNVVKSNELNAWAMPGGKMLFFTGIVDRLKLNDNEIATIMGHEMSHVLLEHGWKGENLKQWTRIFTDTSKFEQPTDIGGAVVGLAQATIALAVNIGVENTFSRSQESDADKLGLMLMAKSGYNPKDAPNLWKKFNIANKDSDSKFKQLLSTHPTHESRYKAMEENLPAAIALYNQSRKVSK
ncbi:M48 family metallopeptidase [Lonepinella sp. BR2271]|uniref:M48 family metallopeptidase n=1 Tax=Lonepinella sp. BR2271 TaxID=3434550 RepID=UPI003F6DE443